MPRNSLIRLWKLARLMNRQTCSPLPVTLSLLKCFDTALTPGETDFLLCMGGASYGRDMLMERLKLPAGMFGELLQSLIAKGTIWSERAADGTERFTLAPIMLGWFEVHLCDGSEAPDKKNFALSLARLFDSWRKFNIVPIRGIRNIAGRFSEPNQRVGAVDPPTAKTIAVNREIVPPVTEVMPGTSVRELIERHAGESSIALVHCFCRQWRKMDGASCRLSLPAESCIVLGKFSEHAVRYGFGRSINRDEALAVIGETRRGGAVHLVWYERDDMNRPEIAICNCCWDCCGVLGSYNRGISSLHFRTSFIALMGAPDECNGCGICAKACPVGAAGIVGKKARIQAGLCIGCGQCALKCPKGCILLEPGDREVMLPLLKKSQARITD